MSNDFCRQLKVAVAMICLTLSSCSTVNVVPGDPNRQFDIKSGKLVFEAQELAQHQKYGEAITKLKEAKALPGLIPYEASTIETMLGAYTYEQGDDSAAIQHYRNSIAANGLLPNEVRNYESNIAQLLIANGDYARGAKMLTDWMQVYGEKPKFLKYAMQAYVNAGDFASALPLAEKWFADPSTKESRPEDLMRWLQTDLQKQDLSEEFPAQEVISCY